MKIRSMFALVLTLVSLAAFSGCTKNQVGCAVQNTATDVLVPAIATGLQCSHPDAILATLQGYGAKAGICTQVNGQASFTGSACTAISGLLISSVASQAIPAAWGCTAANAQAALQSVVNQACAKL